MEDIKKELQKVKEIQELYEINEAELVLMIQFLGVIYKLGWSKKLTYKILQATAALIDIVLEEEKK